MVSGAERIGAKLAVDEGETRITRVGALLRRRSLDELPNLRLTSCAARCRSSGRAHLQVHVEQDTDRRRRRLEARSGLTGWARADGRALLPWSERIELAIWYLENATPRLDLKILALSVRTALTGHGLYRGETGGWR